VRIAAVTLLALQDRVEQLSQARKGLNAREKDAAERLRVGEDALSDALIENHCGFERNIDELVRGRLFVRTEHEAIERAIEQVGEILMSAAQFELPMKEADFLDAEAGALERLASALAEEMMRALAPVVEVQGIVEINVPGTTSGLLLSEARKRTGEASLLRKQAHDNAKANQAVRHWLDVLRHPPAGVAGKLESERKTA
jgi:hypothetical protein